MKETTGTIALWQQETFGFKGSPLTVASRALVEMGELIDLLALGRPPSMPLNEYLDKVLEEAADVIVVLCAMPVFLGYPDAMKNRLWAAVEAKMKINRERTWDIHPETGRGQHVPGPGE